MKVKIKVVLSEDWGQGIVRENWITVQLPSGRELRIFDNNAFELEPFEGKIAEMLLFLGYYGIIESEDKYENNKERIFAGKYLNDYQLPNKWELYGNWKRRETIEYYKNYNDVFKTTDGIFFLSRNKLEKNPLKVGEEIKLRFGRVDLLSWYLIKD